VNRVVNEELIEATKHGTCVACQMMPVSVVHHIQSVGNGGGDVAENLMALCALCHNRIHTGGLRSVVFKHPNLKEWLENQGWRFCCFRLKWVHDNFLS